MTRFVSRLASQVRGKEHGKTECFSIVGHALRGMNDGGFVKMTLRNFNEESNSLIKILRVR